MDFIFPGSWLLKRPAAAIILLILVGFWTACGGGGSDSSAEPPTNEFASVIHIVDGSNDTESLFRTFAGTGPTIMTLSPGQFTAVYNSGNRTISIIDNESEVETQRFQLPEEPEMMVIVNDGRRIFVPMRNAFVSGSDPGIVGLINLESQNTGQINIPRARRAVLSPNGSRLLVFSDNSNSVTIVDTTHDTTQVVAGFDRPVWAVFESDNRALVMSCGPECGGTTAMVQALDMNALTITGSVPVSGATVGLLDGSNLYVAGNSAAGGRLDVLNPTNLTVAQSGIVISDGYHHKMVLHQGKLFIAANNPSFGGGSACLDEAADHSCLTIFDPGTGDAVVPGARDQFGQLKGPVTGLQAIAGRDVVYAAEGGELRIYDTTTNAETEDQITFTGRIVDVLAID
jgi:hypothetical protein